MKKLLLCLLGIPILLLSACNSMNVLSTPRNSAPAQEPSAATTQTSEPTPAPGADLLSIGDSAALGDWEISLTDFYYTDKIDMGAYTYYKPDEGNQYAVAVVRVINNGKELDTFLPSFGTSKDVRAKVYYADEYEYSSTVLWGVNDDLRNETLNPLTSKEGIIAFSIPDVVVNAEDSLVLTFSAGRNKITFSLR